MRRASSAAAAFVRAALALGRAGPLLARVACVPVIAAALLPAHAQGAGPPIMFVVAAVPGGGVDRIARLLAQRIEVDSGRNVVIEYRAGGATRIASELVVKGGPDGNSLLITTGASTIDLAFDPEARPNILTDLVPVAQLAEGQLVFVVNANSSIRNVADLVARARAAPGVLNYGTVNVQSTQRVAGELFKLRTATDLVQIPYKAEVAMMLSIAAGDLDLGIVGIATALPLIEAGKLRPIGVASARRSRVLPEVPTLAEAGVTGVELAQWYGMLAPAGTPANVIEALARSVARANASPEYRQALESMGVAMPNAASPAAFGAMLNREVAKYRDVIETAKLRTQ